MEENVIRFDDVEQKVISLRDMQVILDSDVAVLYGVETRDVNKAVSNNPDKFPDAYVFELTKEEKTEVVENFHHLQRTKFSPVLPKAFSEKGLYMLATVLKSKRATQATIAIVETFAQLRELSRTVVRLSEPSSDEAAQKALLQKGGTILADLLDDGLKTKHTETSIELNLALVKFKHTIKRK